MPIHPSLFTSRSEEWGTPRDLFQKLNREFRFTLDRCATALNAKCRRFFTKQQNRLIQSWRGQRVFMNPPYGKETRFWMEKARKEAAQGARVVCLVPARTNTRWHESVEGSASEARFVKGRVRFGRGSASPCSSPFPSALVI